MITVGSIVEKGRGSIPGTCGSTLDIYGRCTAARCSLQVTGKYYRYYIELVTENPIQHLNYKKS